MSTLENWFQVHRYLSVKGDAGNLILDYNLGWKVFNIFYIYGLYITPIVKGGGYLFWLRVKSPLGITCLDTHLHSVIIGIFVDYKFWYNDKKAPLLSYLLCW